MAANIRLLRRRIKTAKNIAQITKAMEMVAISKMRRAQERTLGSKPYANKLLEVVGNLIGRVEEGSHPYLSEGKKGKTLLVLFSSDKGLCGSLNTNLLREFAKYIDMHDNVEVIAIGRKLEKAVLRLGGVLAADFPFGTTLPPFEAIFPVRSLIVKGFMEGEYRKVLCLYMQFESLSQQRPVITTLLPIQKQTETSSTAEVPYKFEPDAGDLLTSLMPHFLEMSLYQIFLESYASEQAARMLAMHQASENAKDVIWELSLYYNKVRQERITNELLDITGGSMGVAV